MRQVMESFFILIFWVTVVAVIIITAGYPAFLTITSLFVKNERCILDAEPTVTLVIAAYNEEGCIKSKVENSLKLDYPKEQLKIIVASDGSTDRTDEIVESYAKDGILLKRFPRTGKTGVQNQIARMVKSDIIVFSDANAMYRFDAIRKLVRNFSNPGVACVSGQLIYRTKNEGAGASERSYWNYEKFIKKCESKISSLIGANGSIYAVRRLDYVEIDKDLISDLVEPLALVKAGKKIVYEPEAISMEEASETYAVEFRRKVRILTRSIRGVLYFSELLNPLRYGFFSIQLLFHKLFRYLVPLFLIAGFASLISLAIMGTYRAFFLISMVAVATAILIGRGIFLRGKSNYMAKAGHLLYYYLMVNSALFLAWINIFRGMKMVLWAPDRTERL